METFLISLALMVVSYAIQALTAKKPAGVADAKPSTFRDFNFPQVEEGTPQAVFFGDCWTADWMVLHTGNFHTTSIRSPNPPSGKK